MSKSLIGIIGLIVAIISLYFGWQQYQLSQEMKIESQPEVVVCLRSLFYERSNTVGSGDDAISVPKGQVSFRLVNKGGTQVTVSKVVVNPVGTWKDGRQGGLGSIDIWVDKVVPGYGVVSIEKLDFIADFSVKEKFWIDKPESVNVRAFWPSGSGPMLECSPTYSGQWSCGQDVGMGILVDEACQ